MIVGSFLLLMAFFCFTDIKYLTIPNLVVLPAIILGGIMTGFWREAIMMFLIGALFYNRKRCGGGDVKLMAMTGAFVGIWVLPAFIISRISIWLYRIIKKDNKVIPYAPFLMGASIPFIFIM